LKCKLFPQNVILIKSNKKLKTGKEMFKMELSKEGNKKSDFQSDK